MVKIRQSASFGGSSGPPIFARSSPVAAEAGHVGACLRSSNAAGLLISAALPLLHGKDGYDFGLQRSAGDHDVTATLDEDVDFAADTEVGEVDAGFNGEQGAWEDAAIVAGFEVIHVSSVAMNLLSEVMAGAMAEGVAIAGGINHSADGIINISAGDGQAGSKGIADAGDAGVAGGSDDFEDLSVSVGDGGADVAGTG